NLVKQSLGLCEVVSFTHEYPSLNRGCSKWFRLIRRAPCAPTGRSRRAAMSTVHRDLRPLSTQLMGRGILPDEGDNQTDRHVWKGMIAKPAGAIACCASARDVAAAIQFAASRDMLVSVRGGGHNIAGNGVCDDGLVIDLSSMKDIDVDRERQVAQVGGGVVWGEFDAATQRYGLATTGGLIPSTRGAGVPLGGGLGYLMRSCCLACGNLIS